MEPGRAPRARAGCLLSALAASLALACGSGSGGGNGGGGPPPPPPATVTFQPVEGITHIALRVRAKVPGIDASALAEQAEAARTGCPVSVALASVPEITLDAALED